jgi:site-specific recombinase XerD
MYDETRDILLVQKLLGHASINSTQIYTHLVNDRVKEAVERNPLANYKVK